MSGETVTRRDALAAFVTKDGSLVRELMHPAKHANRAQSLAEASVAPGATTVLHRHRTSEELYCILEGRGEMTLDASVFEIAAGDTICILPGVAHRVRNTGAGPLRILCSCSPAYRDEDTELLPVLIAQISDTHIVPKGELLYGRVDSAANLAQALHQLLELDTRPDCVLLTGDLTDRGLPAAYAHLRELLAPIPMPIYAIPGNHDNREPMRAAFRDCAWMPKAAGEPVRYSFDVGPMRVVALDTLVEGEDAGALGADQLAWLDASLDAAKGLPVLIMLHHPPVKSGIPSMDAMRLRAPERLGAIVERHPQIERVVCGHLHRTMHVRWHGTTVSVSPSTVDQIFLAFQKHTPPAAIAEPRGFQLHYWDETDRLITHVVPIGKFAGPFPYD